MNEINRVPSDGLHSSHSADGSPSENRVAGQRDLNDYFRPSIDRVRFVLMFFLSIQILGFPTAIGGYVQVICGFVPVAFYILSGYLVLREAHDREQRILRTIKRTAITFAVLAAVYFVINIFYYKYISINMFSALSSKRTWFNFIVLNVWPFDIGGTIWYVQALLYAYIFIYILEKFNLLRFDWIIAVICLIPTVLTGELAGVINFNFLQYSYIAGNFFTRAIPYVLIGCALHRRNDLFYRIRTGGYITGIAVGAVMSFFEIFILNIFGVGGYYGHLIGMPITAISVCMLAIKDGKDFSRKERKYLPSRTENKIFYYILQPFGIAVSTVLFAVFGYESMGVLTGFVGIFSFLICYAVVLVCKFIRKKLRRRKR